MQTNYKSITTTVQCPEASTVLFRNSMLVILNVVKGVLIYISKRDPCPLWTLESTNMINAIFKNAGKRDRCLLWALEKTTVI